MTAKKGIILGCSIAAALAVLVVIVAVAAIAYLAQDLKGVAVAVNSPTEVQAGQTFELQVVVTNSRSRKAVKLADVDISEQYLAGFTVLTVAPAPKSSEHVPLVNSQSFKFDRLVPAGANETFTFTLRAEKAGVFRGDVDVYEGVKSVTSMAQTSVKEKQSNSRETTPEDGFTPHPRESTQIK